MEEAVHAPTAKRRIVNSGSQLNFWRVTRRLLVTPNPRPPHTLNEDHPKSSDAQLWFKPLRRRPARSLYAPHEVISPGRNSLGAGFESKMDQTHTTPVRAVPKSDAHDDCCASPH